MNYYSESDTGVYLYDFSIISKTRNLKQNQRRIRASARERRRRTALTSALDILREHVPSQEDPKKLSKIQVLRMAREYISRLTDYLESSSLSPYDAFATGERQEINIPDLGYQVYSDVILEIPGSSFAQHFNDFKDECRYLTPDTKPILHGQSWQQSSPSYHSSLEYVCAHDIKIEEFD